MGEKAEKTNLASEYYILSCLYRIEANAHLTLGNKKSVDIIVEKSDSLLTIDVKGLRGISSFPIDNLTKKVKNHFIAFVSYNKKFTNTNHLPEVYIVPSDKLELPHTELDGESLMYVSPSNRKLVHLCRLRKLKDKYKDNWKPFV
jgi:hypothetical protein